MLILNNYKIMLLLILSCRKSIGVDRKAPESIQNNSIAFRFDLEDSEKVYKIKILESSKLINRILQKRKGEVEKQNKIVEEFINILINSRKNFHINFQKLLDENSKDKLIYLEELEYCLENIEISKEVDTYNKTGIISSVKGYFGSASNYVSSFFKSNRNNQDLKVIEKKVVEEKLAEDKVNVREEIKNKIYNLLKDVDRLNKIKSPLDLLNLIRMHINFTEREANLILKEINQYFYNKNEEIEELKKIKNMLNIDILKFTDEDLNDLIKNHLEGLEFSIKENRIFIRSSEEIFINDSTIYLNGKLKITLTRNVVEICGIMLTDQEVEILA